MGMRCLPRFPRSLVLPRRGWANRKVQLADRSRTSIICAIGVMPAMGSLVNCRCDTRARPPACRQCRPGCRFVDHAGVLGFGAVQAGKDEVLAGAARTAQHAQDFNLHGFGRFPEKRPGGAGHARTDLVQREKWGVPRWGRRLRNGLRRGGRAGRGFARRFGRGAGTEKLPPAPQNQHKGIGGGERAPGCLRLDEFPRL